MLPYRSAKAMLLPTTLQHHATLLLTLSFVSSNTPCCQCSPDRGNGSAVPTKQQFTPAQIGDSCPAATLNGSPLPVCLPQPATELPCPP